MAVLKAKYGAKTVITPFTLASLANGAARASVAVDNGTNLFLDAHVGGFITGNATGVSATGYLVIYAYGSADDGATYSDGATGTDAAHTINKNLRQLDRIALDAVSERAEFGPFSVAEVFGGVLPEDWGIVIENQTGAALDATAGNHEIHFQGLNIESV